MSSVRTRFGDVHIDDIPIVVPEPLTNKIKSSIVFFGILIIMICIVIFIMPRDRPYKKHVLMLPKMLSSSKTSVVINSITVSNFNTLIDLENIVLITVNGNVINIDVKRNPYIVAKAHGQGIAFSLNLQSEYEVKEIVLISSETNYIHNVNVDMYLHGPKVWEYSGSLEDRRENVIHINELLVKPNKTQKTFRCKKNDKLITNEHEMALVLSADGDSYSTY